jgi:hypothetical protein
MTNTLIQIALAVFGLTAMWMAMGHNAKGRKWAPVVGLCGQPAWMLFSWQSQAWGLMLLSVAWSLVYVRGIAVQWGD